MESKMKPILKLGNIVLLEQQRLQNYIIFDDIQSRRKVMKNKMPRSSNAFRFETRDNSRCTIQLRFRPHVSRELAARTLIVMSMGSGNHITSSGPWAHSSVYAIRKENYYLTKDNLFESRSNFETLLSWRRNSKGYPWNLPRVLRFLRSIFRAVSNVVVENFSFHSQVKFWESWKIKVVQAQVHCTKFCLGRAQVLYFFYCIDG